MITSKTGSEGAHTSAPLDEMHTGNIRPQAPVQGSTDSKWTDKIPPTPEVSTSGDGETCTLGKWPISDYGNSPKQRSV